MRYAMLAALALGTLVAPATAAQQNVDREGVRRAALDYLEGFYEGDSAKLVRSVRPDARKIGYFTNRGAPTYESEEMSYTAMIDYANRFRKNGRTTPSSAPREVIVGEVNDQTATAKVVAWWGIDYLQLARYNGKWMIVNVMWQSPPK
jgi:putative lumazine-binding protein